MSVKMTTGPPNARMMVFELLLAVELKFGEKTIVPLPPLLKMTSEFEATNRTAEPRSAI